MRVQSILLVLAVALAGCSDDPAPAGDPDVAVGDDGQPLAVLHDINLVGEPSFVEESFEGSFEFPADWAAGLAGTPVVKEHDISQLIGDGPQFVTASVEGDVEIQFVPDDFAQIWTFDSNDPTGPTEIEGAIGPGGLAIQVIYPGTAPAELVQHAQAIDYTLTVTVARDPARIPSGMALEVELPGPGSSVVFTGDGGDVPTVLVYGPDDTYMGVLDAAGTIEETMGANATGGKYVFMPQGHGSFYALQVGTVGEGERYQPQARLVRQTLDTPIAQTFEAGTEHSQTWDLRIDAKPLQLGVCMGSEFGGSNMDLRLTGPEGIVAQVAFGGQFTILTGACDFTVMGDPDLPAGDYELSYSDSGSEGMSVQAFVVHYAR